MKKSIPIAPVQVEQIGEAVKIKDVLNEIFAQLLSNRFAA